MNLTESPSNYDNLEQLSVEELLKIINNEDKKVPSAVEKAIPQIEILILNIVKQLKNGGRLFYLGAGTSGRLGIVDASECPPTFGVAEDLVTGVIAGGKKAITKAVEFAEDDHNQAWKDLEHFKITEKDVVIGLSASGSTPYVISAIKKAREKGMVTGCITCNSDTPLAKASEFPVEILVGPEIITGSTRMKAGTAQKLALNMISTTVMIQLGRIKGNKMVDMQLSNNKLIARGITILIKELGVDAVTARQLLDTHKSVRKAIEWYSNHA